MVSFKSAFVLLAVLGLNTVLAVAAGPADMDRVREHFSIISEHSRSLGMQGSSLQPSSGMPESASKNSSSASATGSASDVPLMAINHYETTATTPLHTHTTNGVVVTHVKTSGTLTADTSKPSTSYTPGTLAVPRTSDASMAMSHHSAMAPSKEDQVPASGMVSVVVKTKYVTLKNTSTKTITTHPSSSLEANSGVTKAHGHVGLAIALGVAVVMVGGGFC